MKIKNMESLSGSATQPENEITISSSNDNTIQVSTTSSMTTCTPSNNSSHSSLHCSSPLSLPSIKDSAIHLTEFSCPTPSFPSTSSSYLLEPSSLEDPFTHLPSDLYLPLNLTQPAHVPFHGPKTSVSPTAKIAILTAAVACSKHVRHMDLEKCMSSWLTDVSVLSSALEDSELKANQLKQGIGHQLGTISHLRQELTQAHSQLQQTQWQLHQKHRSLQEHQLQLTQSQTQIETLNEETRILRSRLLELEQTASMLSQQALQYQSQLRSNPLQEEMQQLKEHYFHLLEQRDHEHATLLNNLCFLCRKQVGRF